MLHRLFHGCSPKLAALVSICLRRKTHSNVIKCNVRVSILISERANASVVCFHCLWLRSSVCIHEVFGRKYKSQRKVQGGEHATLLPQSNLTFVVLSSHPLYGAGPDQWRTDLSMASSMEPLWFRSKSCSSMTGSCAANVITLFDNFPQLEFHCAQYGEQATLQSQQHIMYPKSGAAGEAH